jgi:UDP-N-acetylglucosamine 2-epimerase
LKYPVIFPIHPRTKNILSNNNVCFLSFPNISFTEPVSYFELVKLQMQAKLVITDSGGVQKEAYLLRKKCITLRSETEWEETLANNWNMLVYENLGDIHKHLETEPGVYIDGVFGKGETAIEITKRIREIV